MIPVQATIKTDPNDLLKDADDLGDVLQNFRDTLDGFAGGDKYKKWLIENLLTKPDGTRIDMDALWRCYGVVDDVAEQGRGQ